jgi:hypothetical protein
MIGKPGRRRIDPVKRRPTHHHERTAREGRPWTTPGLVRSRPLVRWARSSCRLASRRNGEQRNG